MCRWWRLTAVGLLAVGVTGAIYLAGRLIQPDYTFSLLGSNPYPVKAALATVVLGLAVVQVVLALRIYGLLPAGPLRVIRPAHRITGAIAFLITVPVALHCLVAYGAQLYAPRVAVHSVAGCFLYGAFAAKVLIVQSRRLPGWLLPVAGGSLAIIIGILWYTSALWYYNGYALP